MLIGLRELTFAAAPGLTEEVKWGTGVWARNGLVCAAGAFKDHVKVNFQETPLGWTQHQHVADIVPAHGRWHETGEASGRD